MKDLIQILIERQEQNIEAGEYERAEEDAEIIGIVEDLEEE